MQEPDLRSERAPDVRHAEEGVLPDAPSRARRQRRDFPFQVLMESTTACQLRCIMCARESVLRKGSLKMGRMKRELAEKIVDEIAEVDPDTRLWFCFFGEPTLSRDLEGRIRYAKSKGLTRTVINTNGNALTPEKADRLLDAGLDEIWCGIDAATRETYEQVRVRGNWDVLMANLDHLLEVAEGRCKVTVQFGQYAENEHEVDAFREYWSGRGVPVFVRPKLTWIGFLEEHQSTDAERWPCAWQFDNLPIWWDGTVGYCVCDWENRMPIGDINRQSIREVWRTARARWQEVQLRRAWDELPEFCRQCRDWQTKPAPEEAVAAFERDGCWASSTGL